MGITGCVLHVLQMAAFDDLFLTAINLHRLWDVLGPGEVHSIAAYAAAHYKTHRRPLRIAVDEACWRFTNLTPEQIARIQENEPAANPMEKVILWRMLRLLRLNIQLLFVWDGLRKPGKSRRGGFGGGLLDRKIIERLHRLFDRLGIPHHRAPGEAEAECARLQRLGVVDAVWSDDGDSFMFGCGTLVKAHKERDERGGGQQQRVADSIRVYHATTIREQLGLDADSLVLFALLAGGDYELAGLKGCGVQIARRIARVEVGLARELAIARKEDLPIWRMRLREVLRAHGRGAVEVPESWPAWKVLEGYRHPAISTDEQLRDLRGLRNGWDWEIDLQMLRTELRERYNFQTREFLKHIAPVFLARTLARCKTQEQQEENLALGVEMKATRKRKKKTSPGDDDDDGHCDEAEGGIAAKEVKILFTPRPLLRGLNVSVMPADEDWSKSGTADKPFDPLKKVECELLECFLRNGLPQTFFADDENQAAGTSVPSTVGRESSSTNNTAVPSPSINVAHGSTSTGNTSIPKKRGRPPGKSTSGSASSGKKSKVGNAVPKQPVSTMPPRPTFKRLSIPDFSARVQQTGGSAPVDSSQAMSQSYTAVVRTATVAPSSSTSPQLPRPGGVFSPDALRRLRPAALFDGTGARSASSQGFLSPSTPARPQSGVVRTPAKSSSSTWAEHEIIDLT